MDSNKDNAPGSQVWHADANPNSSTGILVARSTRSPVGTRLFPHNLDMSPSNVEYPVKNLIPTYDVNLVARRTTKWSGSTSTHRFADHFRNASMKAAVHVDTDYEASVRVTRTPEFSEIRCSLSLTQKEVVDQQNEIFGIFTIDSDEIPWMRSIVLHEGAMNVSDSKSVLLLRIGTSSRR